jgi:ribosomal protein S18 acetylase RimI-like enzyme
MAGLLIGSGPKESHKGFLWGMYVQPGARRSGVGRQLISALLDFARSQVELVQLSAVVSNESARRLYARLGFVEYGIEKNSLKHNGKYYDEVLMAKDLTADDAL